MGEMAAHGCRPPPRPPRASPQCPSWRGQPKPQGSNTQTPITHTLRDPEAREPFKIQSRRENLQRPGPREPGLKAQEEALRPGTQARQRCRAIARQRRLTDEQLASPPATLGRTFSGRAGCPPTALRRCKAASLSLSRAPKPLGTPAGRGRQSPAGPGLTLPTWGCSGPRGQGGSGRGFPFPSGLSRSLGNKHQASKSDLCLQQVT